VATFLELGSQLAGGVVTPREQRDRVGVRMVRIADFEFAERRLAAGSAHGVEGAAAAPSLGLQSLPPTLLSSGRCGLTGTSLARIWFSISLASSGRPLRKSRALSLPWPIRSPL